MNYKYLYTNDAYHSISRIKFFWTMVFALPCLFLFASIWILIAQVMNYGHYLNTVQLLPVLIIGLTWFAYPFVVKRSISYYKKHISVMKILIDDEAIHINRIDDEIHIPVRSVNFVFDNYERFRRHPYYIISYVDNNRNAEIVIDVVSSDFNRLIRELGIRVVSDRKEARKMLYQKRFWFS